MVTPRDQALAAFRKRWKKDAESDGEDLPVEKQRENAFLEGWDDGRLFQFYRMKKERPVDPVYWDMHEENVLDPLHEGEKL